MFLVVCVCQSGRPYGVPRQLLPMKQCTPSLTPAMLKLVRYEARTVNKRAVYWNVFLYVYFWWWKWISFDCGLFNKKPVAPSNRAPVRGRGGKRPSTPPSPTRKNKKNMATEGGRTDLMFLPPAHPASGWATWLLTNCNELQCWFVRYGTLRS